MKRFLKRDSCRIERPCAWQFLSHVTSRQQRGNTIYIDPTSQFARSTGELRKRLTQGVRGKKAGVSPLAAKRSAQCTTCWPGKDAFGSSCTSSAKPSSFASKYYRKPVRPSRIQRSGLLTKPTIASHTQVSRASDTLIVTVA